MPFRAESRRDSSSECELPSDQSDNESTIESEDDIADENELDDLAADQNADLSEYLKQNYGIELPAKEIEAKQSTKKRERDDALDSVTQKAQSMLPTGLTLTENIVTTKIPTLLRGKLRDYQHIGLDWLVSLFNQGLNGILADEMGLGKTIQTISLLAHLACDGGDWGPHLIIVPTSVLLNWDLEFKKFLPGFKVITYYGSQNERKERRKGWSAPNAMNVCITSYNLAVQDHRVFKRIKWKYLILDEAHNIKNWMSQRWQTLLSFKSSNRLLLTGTPLQNNLLELWALLHFLMPDLFDSRKGTIFVKDN